MLFITFSINTYSMKAKQSGSSVTTGKLSNQLSGEVNVCMQVST